MIPFDATGAFRPTTVDKELHRFAIRGAAATIIASGIGLAVQVVGTIVLARLLTPADFGVVTMVTTVSLLIASFGLNGFTEAVIQFEEIDHYTASNLFWLNSGAGLVLAIAFAAGGTLLARLYHNPLVASVAEGVSLAIFFGATSVIHLALLKRAMRFGGTSTNDFVGRVVYTAVPILLASRGWGYWALVAGIVAQQLGLTVGAWWLCRWIPSLPRRTGKTGAMVRFAAKVYGQFCLRYSTRNVDNLLVGWRFNAVALGFYKKAYDLFALSASQLTAPMDNVALAALSRLNQDPARFRRYFANALGIIAFVGMAVSADLTLVGRDVVRLVLGAQWSESGTIFQLFGPGIGAMLLSSTVGWIHLSIGKPGRWLRWTAVEFAVTFSLFLLALPWGPKGNCCGVERVLLHPPSSRLLVCRATDRIRRFTFDWHCLAVWRLLAPRGVGNRGCLSRHSDLGFSTRAWCGAGGNNHNLIGLRRVLHGGRSAVALGFRALPPDGKPPTGTRPSTNCREPGRFNQLETTGDPASNARAEISVQLPHQGTRYGLQWRQPGCYSRRQLAVRPPVPLISFTFDDFSPVGVPQHAGAILERYGLLGTYYVSLSLAGQHSQMGPMYQTEDLKALARLGHELGCHTFGHCHSWNTPADIYEKAILANQQALE